MSNELVEWFQGPPFFLEVSKGSASYTQRAHSHGGLARLTAWDEGVPPWRRTQGKAADLGPAPAPAGLSVYLKNTPSPLLLRMRM